MKRKLAYLAVALLLILAALFLFGPRNPINRDTYDKIQIGMTLAEAEAIIGRPGMSFTEIWGLMIERGDPFVASEVELHEGHNWTGNFLDLDRLRCWEGSYRSIAILPDNAGRIIGKHYEQKPTPSGLRGIVERFRRWGIVR